MFAKQQSIGANPLDHNLLNGVSPEQSLRNAWTQIYALRARPAALSTPPAAQHLRTLLLKLTDEQAAMTRELADLVDFLPRFSLALGWLGPATRRLEVALSQRSASGAAAVAAVFAAKAAALRQFQASVNGTLAKLRRLRPPAVSKPTDDAQVASLKGMGSSAGALATALAAGGSASVQPLLLQFDRAATSTQSVGVQKAEIAAARAYDRRSATLTQLSQAVTEERLRLANTLR
jgi:hypothetical protein